MSAADPGSGLRRRSTSRRWLQPRVGRDQLYRLAPARFKPQPIRASGAWDHARRVLRSWVLWLGFLTLFLVLGWWFAAVGAAVLAFAFYHTTPRAHPLVYPVQARLHVDSPEFAVTLGGVTATPYEPGNRVDLLVDGDEFYPAMIEAIEGAERSVTMEQYIWWDSNVGRRFAEAFAEKARAGVPVKLLVDAIGSATIGEEILRVLEAGGCELAWYRPIRWYTIGRANNRTHRKSIIVDGRIAFTGGAGLADHWLNQPGHPTEWRDMMARVEGPAALAQQSGFAQNWLITTGELLSGPDFFPMPEARGEVAVQTILSSPKEGAGAAATMYLLALQSARRSIRIANPYFIPSPAVIELIRQAAHRGARVQLIVAGRHSDTWWARQNSARLYGQLMDAGVEIGEYEPTMLHHKFMVIDGAWATIGTTNFDNRSFALNEETNLCFRDPRLIAELERVFAEDLAQSRKVNRYAWRRRGAWQRAQELVASLIQDQV